MPNKYKKSNSNSSSSSSGKIQRVVIKQGWDGVRLNVSPQAGLRTESSLLDVISDVRTQFPAGALEHGQATLLHLRQCVAQKNWNDVTLGEVGIQSGGSALLTLNLPGVVSPNYGGKPEERTSNSNSNSNSSSGRSTMTNNVPSTMDTTTTHMSSTSTNTSSASASAVPTTTTTTTPLTTEQCLDKLLTSHFDADVQDCLKTLMKLLDNILHKPHDHRTRSVRVHNPAFYKKVATKAGGLEFLLACGFTCDAPEFNDSDHNHNMSSVVTTSSFTATATFTLLPQHESSDRLYRARQLLHRRALDEVGMTDLPALRRPPLRKPATTTSTTFDVYASHSHHTTPHQPGPPERYESTTERELERLNQQAKKMDQSLATKPLNRQWTAYPPPSSSQPTTTPHQVEVVGPESSHTTTGDGALLAQHMKRMNDERKKREEGGFTTKAMRDLEKMKKTKVFSHGQLRICFPDGVSVSANFKPNETMGDVQTLLYRHVLRSSSVTVGSASSYSSQFDLYVTPPRRVLSLDRTLRDEGLLPAARVFLSWKKGSSPVGVREELFRNDTSLVSSFPTSQRVAEEERKNHKVTKASTKVSEDELMKRMLGKSPSLFSKKKKSNTDDSKKTSNTTTKPKWFPK